MADEPSKSRLQAQLANMGMTDAKNVDAENLKREQQFVAAMGSRPLDLGVAPPAPLHKRKVPWSVATGILALAASTIFYIYRTTDSHTEVEATFRPKGGTRIEVMQKVGEEMRFFEGNAPAGVPLQIRVTADRDGVLGVILVTATSKVLSGLEVRKLVSPGLVVDPTFSFTLDEQSEGESVLVGICGGGAQDWMQIPDEEFIAAINGGSSGGHCTVVLRRLRP